MVQLKTLEVSVRKRPRCNPGESEMGMAGQPYLCGSMPARKRVLWETSASTSLEAALAAALPCSAVRPVRADRMRARRAGIGTPR